MLRSVIKKNDGNDKKQSTTCFQAFTNEEIEIFMPKNCLNQVSVI